MTRPREPLVGLDLLGDCDDRLIVLGHHYATREFLEDYRQVENYETFDPTIFYHWAPMFVRQKERPSVFRKLFNRIVDVRYEWLFNRNRDVFYVDCDEAINDVVTHLNQLIKTQKPR